MRGQRTARLQARVRTAQTAIPMASAAGTVQPGIALRPALDAGEIPTSVVTGDFNGDGHMDFVVANGLTSDLWLYLGNGDGTFQLPRVIPLTKGVAPVMLAAADTRNSGKLDLVVAEADSFTIGVLLGNGDGTFGVETVYNLPEPPNAIVVDDFNHDGKPDIAAVMVTGVEPFTHDVPYIALLYGDGAGNFSNPIVTNNSGFYSTAWNLASGDVNGDGLPDLLITGPGNENSTIYLNNGDGTFSQGPVILESGAFNSVLDGRLADVNGDGCLDAVVADAYSQVWIRLGDCAGHFGNYSYFLTGDSNAALAVVDVNGDGIPDIVTSSLPAFYDLGYGTVAGNSMSVALGLGGGKFGVPRNYIGTSQAYSIAVADFNGDGKPDFVTANNDTDTVSVYQNDGSGGFGFPQGLFAGVPGQGVLNSPASSLSFADFNRDGKNDVFFLDEGYNGEYYATSFLNDGTGKFSDPVSSDTGLATPGNWIGDYRLGNFRDAQHLDLVAIGLDQSATTSTQFIAFLPGNPDGTFAKGTPVATTGADGILTTGDFNHDGKLDFVAVNGSGTHTLTTFLGNGDGTFRALAPVTFSDSQATLALRIWTGDFNRDGKLDVLIFTSGNGYGDSPCVWELDGKGDGTFQTPRQIFRGFQPFALADLNGDGYPDIARYDYLDSNGMPQTVGPSGFTNYLGQADGTFAQISSVAPYAGVPLYGGPYVQDGEPLFSSQVADLNGDGKADEVAYQWSGQAGTLNYAQILIGNGDGTFTPTYDEYPFYLGRLPLYARDLDGDGAADLVDLVTGSSSLQVFKSNRAAALQIALKDPVVTGNASCGWVFANLASSSAQTVTLSSSVTGVQLPASVTIPAGAGSAQFCYTLATNFDWRQVFDVDAQLNGDTATAYASSAYSLGFNVGLSRVSPAVLYGGQSTDPVTVTATAVPGYSSTAKLYCLGLAPGDSCQFASDSVSISPASSATTTVIFVLASDAVDYGNLHSFTVIVDDGTMIRRQTTSVTVSPLLMGSFTDPLIMAASGSASENTSLLGIPPFAVSCSGLPAGATCSFSETPATYPASSTLTMALATSAATPPGSYPVQVKVTSGPQTALQSFTLAVLTVKVQGPDASKDWVLTTAEQTTTLMVSANVSANANLGINCSLDVAESSCFGASVPISPTAQPASLTISVPSNTPPAQHVLTVKAVAGLFAQTFTFPFYVADYSGTLDASSLSLARGGSGKVNATLNATTGFVDTVTLGCSGSSEITCSFAPASSSLTGGTPQTVAITFAAGPNAQATPPVPLRMRGLFTLAALAPLGLAFGLRRRMRTPWFVLLSGIALLIPATSCGSGGGSSGGGGGGGSNTYAITVTASIPNTTSSKTLGVVNVTVTH